MKEVLIFAGTTEGRKLSERLADAGIHHTICVATEYGEIALEPHPFAKVHQGRMRQEEIEAFLVRGRFTVVVDATHPYAKEITRNIRAAVKRVNAGSLFTAEETLSEKFVSRNRELETKVSYFRLERAGTISEENVNGRNLTYFQSNEACAKTLEHTSGNILLTTGSKELSEYCISEEVKSRLYVRVLPGMESLSLCMEQGICGKQIIAMQGPFTEEMNEAMIRQFRISHLVTKESGTSGGYQEKLEAAQRTGAQVYVIGRPRESEGYSFAGICNILEKMCGKKILSEAQMEVVLAGLGMGHRDGLTKEVQRAVEEADILLGAERMLRDFCPKLEKQPFYQAEQIIPYLKKVQERNLFLENRKVVILFSGDSGFYSGCQSVYAALKKEIREKRLNASLRILPGISSVACLASWIGESYHDAAIYSIHGKKLCNLARRIANSPKTFLLTSGVRDINWLGEQLEEAGLSECRIVTGYQLSYGEQQIRECTPSQCRELKEEGLYTCFVRNPYAARRKLTHGLADEQFIRDKVPMTKAEVREVSICKLRLHDRAVVYDIGSGTGSVAVEIASLSDDIQVYAVERKKEALSLIEKNKERYRLQNITVVEANAPEGLAHLPVATHAFIGGSGGKLKEILTALQQINPAMRVVINAVSIETIGKMREMISLFPVKEEEIVQVQVSRAKKAGNHYLMQAENPVWICSFAFATGE